ncbi:B3 domain-containing protein Os11g0197600-like [Telopea speciosissima]|uniref:B3 domain-containing protein Os11g0197600-like n=1 Tax=Telopea speciosissima TaxID=54955 RepID=UPI001CC7A4F5|nr:B3 domain-containing protein Os11g0197600-like [Telopea speciosissima]
MVRSCWSRLEKRPHFFKVFLPGFSSECLKIPIAFFKHLKERASCVVSLTGPSGNTWQVRLVWNIDGWFFQDGWPMFVRDHSIQVGDFIVFKYDGESQFSVRIFDKSGCEKQAAFSVSCSQDTGFIIKNNGKKRGRDVMETCLQGVAKKNRSKYPQVCLERTTQERAVKAEIFYENNSEKKAVVSGKCCQDTNSVRDDSKHKQNNTVATPFSLLPCAVKKERRNFSPATHLENETNKTVVIVEDSDESADDRKKKQSKTVTKSFSFLPYVTNNKRRDSSVIHLENETKKTVVKAEDSDESCDESGSKRHNVFASKRHNESDFLGDGKKQGRPPKKKKAKGMHSSSNKAVEGTPSWNGGVNTKHYTKSAENLLREFRVSGQSPHLNCSDFVPRKTVPAKYSCRRSLISQRPKVTIEEVQKTFDAAHAFQSKNPSAVVVMKRGYVYVGFYLALPSTFIKEFLPKKNQEMILWDLDDKAWPVKYVYADKPYLRGGFSAGWAKFSMANNLELSDVCVFELIKAKEMRVHIFRVVEEVTPPIKA